MSLLSMSMSLSRIALIPVFLASSAHAQQASGPSATYFSKGPATNFDVFKQVPAQFPSWLDDSPAGKRKPSYNAMVPNVLDYPLGAWQTPPKPTEAPIPSSLLTAAATSIVVMNASKGPMFLLPVDVDGAVEFEIVATKVKTLDLPSGRTTLTLSYSIAGQRKQIVLSAGRGYMLDVDAQKREIVTRVTVVGASK